jgi:hypothetical protein
MYVDTFVAGRNAVGLFAHEGGHNLGLDHANSRDFGSEALGPIGASGTITEYGDPFSVMGGLGNLGFYSAQHAAEYLNWHIAETNYEVVESGGSFTIQNYEKRPSGLKALRIRRGTGNNAWLWLEYRQNIGIYNSQNPPGGPNGVLVHFEDALTLLRPTTDLLDYYQPELNYFSDPLLPSGSTWKDPYSDVSIGVSNASPSSVDISVWYGKRRAGQLVSQ